MRFIAGQAAHAAEKMRKAFEVAGFLQLPAAHHRREAQDFRIRLAIARDQRTKSVDDLLEHGRARVNAVDAARQQQRLRDRIQRMSRPRRLLECNVHFVCASLLSGFGSAKTQSPIESGAPFKSEAAPILARMRSLLIMTGEERISRRCRPMLNSPSLR